MKFDCLIVGQGIAGSVLSFLLEQRGLKVLVVDDAHRSSCSTIAAGLWNPVSFKNLHLTWRFDEFLESATAFYRSMESELQTELFFPLKLSRIFPDASSANEWDSRSINPELEKFLGNDVDDDVTRNCNQPFGHGVVNHAGWVDVSRMLKSIRDRLSAKNGYIEEKFEYNDLIPGEVECTYHNYQIKSVVFATGVMNSENPWFKNLPVIPNKGQVLTVRLAGAPFSHILNYGNFLLPIGNDIYKLGATYEREYGSDGPTADARDAFIQNLGQLYKGPVEILSHDAGFRPTTPDRKPVIGQHPEYKNLYMFNGLGSKGVALAPWHATRLADMIMHQIPVEKEVSISRYWK